MREGGFGASAEAIHHHIAVAKRRKRLLISPLSSPPPRGRPKKYESPFKK
jgi:hypothetical protein